MWGKTYEWDTQIDMGHIAKKLNFKKIQKHYNDPKRSGAYSGAAALQQSIKLKLAVVKKKEKRLQHQDTLCIS